MTATSAVVVYSGDGGVAIERRAVRPLGSREILLRVRACGLCGTDLFKLQNDSVAHGTVLGHELVATVENVGDEVSGVVVGERVVVPHHVSCGTCASCLAGAEPLCPAFRENLLDPGGFSELVIVREKAVREAIYRFSDSVADEAAIFLEPAACVVRGVRRSGIFDNTRSSTSPIAVILGAGSMGLLHLLVLKAMNPSAQVIISDFDENRRNLARTLGADVVAEPSSLASAVTTRSKGIGVDAVFDTAGRPDSLGDHVALLRGGGTIVLFAHGANGRRAGFDFNDFFKRECRMIATYSSSLSDQIVAHQLIEVARLDASALVTHVLPFSRFHEAVELCRQRQALKVLMVPEGET
ncbi:MAG: alcohol dehydrogenase catalytic domain-containing protein [Acidobacteriota bacterium]